MMGPRYEDANSIRKQSVVEPESIRSETEQRPHKIENTKCRLLMILSLPIRAAKTEGIPGKRFVELSDIDSIPFSLGTVNGCNISR